MKQSQTLRVLRWTRIPLAIALCWLLSPLGVVASIVGLGAPFLINPTQFSFATFPNPGGSSLSQITGATTGGADAQQVEWEMEIVQSAYQQSPFSDNMVGRLGSGKPIVEHTSTKTVAGQAIVISTIDSLGAPIIQGSTVRVGTEEQIKPGDFRLSTSIGFISAAIDNTGMTQSVVGIQWNRLTQKLLARRLAKQQNDDRLAALKFSATALNTKYPNGKSIDVLLSSDTYQTGLIKGSASLAKDLGAIPMNVNPNVDATTMEPPPIHRFLQFLTDAGARPIKDESAYQQGLSYAADRGKDNPLFTGEYQEWDNNIIYPWVNVRHGGYGSVGSAMQPEALLGVVIPAQATSSGVIPGGATSSTAGGIVGGGSTTAAAVTPYRNYFEHFSLFTYTPISGTFGTAGPASSGGAVPLSFNLRPSGTYANLGFVGVINKTSPGKWTFFQYTTNGAVASYGSSVLTGITRLGSAITGDYNTTVGACTYGTAPYLSTGDNNGFQGVDTGAVAVGSVMYECNAKGVPLCFGLCLGEMALVEGYSRVPINNGTSFKAMVNRVDYTYPYNQAFGRGLEVAWGCAAFQRPDGLTPNYVLEIFARSVDGFPNVTS
jgi:hypothetical protein